MFEEYPTIIEIKKEASLKQIDMLQKMNPKSIIVFEDSFESRWLNENINNYNDVDNLKKGLRLVKNKI